MPPHEQHGGHTHPLSGCQYLECSILHGKRRCQYRHSCCLFSGRPDLPRAQHCVYRKSCCLSQIQGLEFEGIHISLQPQAGLEGDFRISIARGLSHVSNDLRIYRGTEGLEEDIPIFLRGKGQRHSGTRNLLTGCRGLLPSFRSALEGVPGSRVTSETFLVRGRQGMPAVPGERCALGQEGTAAELPFPSSRDLQKEAYGLGAISPPAFFQASSPPRRHATFLNPWDCRSSAARALVFSACHVQ